MRFEDNRFLGRERVFTSETKGMHYENVVAFYQVYKYVF